MVKNIDNMMELLSAMGAHVVGTTDEFYGRKNDNNGIWLAADRNPELFDYHGDNFKWRDTFGVDPKLNTIVEQGGWYFEWYDPGTIMVWEN
tara:strand:- start:506 stop:778 length:273 start_codon:yes stop_codon:yes gene_type:complete